MTYSRETRLWKVSMPEGKEITVAARDILAALDAAVGWGIAEPYDAVSCELLGEVIVSEVR